MTTATMPSGAPPAISAVINQALAREHFAEKVMREVFTALMSGAYTPAQVSAFLIAMRAKSETAEELFAAASVMRELATPVAIEDVIDIVGTGGDAQSSFNISTTAMIVAAAAGARVAKHGGRAVSSSSGSADVLEAAGVNLNMNPAAVAESIDALGLGFMFAPNFHLAMKHGAAVRREIGVRTMFNLLGPLANPARVEHILLGVFNGNLLPLMAEVLARLGTKRAWVVHNDIGVDEIALCAPTRVFELRDGVTRQFVLTPEELGLPYYPIALLRVANKNESLQLMRDILEARATTVPQRAARDTVLANAAAALYINGRVPDLAEGVVKARQAIESGAAALRLTDFVALSQRLGTQA